MIHSYSYLFVMFLLIVLSCSYFYSCLFHHTFIHLFVQAKLFFLISYSCLFCHHFDSLISNWYPPPPPSSLPCVDVGIGAWSSKLFQVQPFSKKIQAQVFFLFLCLFFFVCGVSLFLFTCFGFVSIYVWIFYYLHMFCI